MGEMMSAKDLCYNTNQLRDCIRKHLDECRLSGAEKASIFGGRGKMSEVLNGKIPLSKNTIRALHQMFDIDLHFLIFGDE
jgi:antitoxin component HigA of HigAB toxin-antitoxin module